MKKRLFSLLLALVMALSLIPAAAWAEDAHEEHDDTTWVGITDLSEIKSGGSYYLLNDVEPSGIWVVPSGGVKLCLNGKSINSSATAAIQIEKGNSLELTDCHTGDEMGKVTHGHTTHAEEDDDRGILNYGTLILQNGRICGNGGRTGAGVYNEGTFTMNGGVIEDNCGKIDIYNDGRYQGYYTAGGGVANRSNATFTMNGGTITNNGAQRGGGVYNEGTFLMNGGSISGNHSSGNRNNDGTPGTGAGVYNAGSFTLKDGKISDNIGKTYAFYSYTVGYTKYVYSIGSGVFCEKGTFAMSGGSIEGNENQMSGGGVYVKDGTVTMTGGTIQKNKAENFGMTSPEGGGMYIEGGTVTVSGGSITQNEAAWCGGGVYLNGGSFTLGDSRALETRAEITNNTANGYNQHDHTTSDPRAGWGGGIYVNGGTLTVDSGIITGNSAYYNGGGIDYGGGSSDYTAATVTLKGGTQITGNTSTWRGEKANNLHLGKDKTISARNLYDHNFTIQALVGIHTAADPVQSNGTIKNVRITNDRWAADECFTSDAVGGYRIFRDNDAYMYLTADIWTVKIELDYGSWNTVEQSVVRTQAMKAATITTWDNYYFPTDYVSKLTDLPEGLTVTRDSYSKITISGTPTADISYTLPAATRKETQVAPTGLLSEGTSKGGSDGKIIGTTSAMEWSTDRNNWKPCTADSTTVGGKGTYYVRYAATDTKTASAYTVVSVYEKVEFPVPELLQFTYNGNEQTLLQEDDSYTIRGDNKATNAGRYSVTLTVKDGYQWSSEPASSTINWVINKKTAEASDFTFTAPKDLIWDGSTKMAAVELNSPLELNGNTMTVVYKTADGQEVAEPAALGTYKVFVRISGTGNFEPTVTDLTADGWTFEIVHPAEHSWSDWQHDGKEHWRTCTIPGCDAEERAEHTTDAPATCTAKAVCAGCAAEYGELDAHNHTAGKVTSNAYTAPTCGSKGHEAYSYCADCGKYFKDGDDTLYDDASQFDIPALSHQNAKRTDAVAATCEVGGNDAYWYCADCGKYYADKDGQLDASAAYESDAAFRKDALGHDFEGQPYQSDDSGHWQVCKRCTAETDHEAHSGAAATCVAASKCDTCGYKLADIDPDEHVDLRKTDAVAATCTEGGNDAYWYCAGCGKYYADKDGQLDASAAYESRAAFLKKALDHDFTAHDEAEEHLKSDATCTEDAVYYLSCSRCGMNGTETFAAENTALDHDFTVHDKAEEHLKNDATCTADAVYYVSCTRCGVNGTETFTEENTATGHSFTDYVYNNDATYDADGTETAVCDHGCGETDTRTKAGSKLIDSQAPVVTGAENGKVYCKKAVITVTDDNSVTVTLNGQSAELVDGKLTVAALEGEQTLVVTDRFGNTTTVTFTVSADHTPDEGKITTPATVDAEGVKTITCTTCGEVLRTEPIAKLPKPADETGAPTTGDASRPTAWMALAALSAAGLLAMLEERKRRHNG